MATATVTSLLKGSTPGFRPVINEKLQKASGTEEFDPKKHIDFKFPSEVHSMADLKLPVEFGVSPIAVSEPFPLFSEDAVQCMRGEIFRPEVWENCQYSSNLAQCQLRGFAAK